MAIIDFPGRELSVTGCRWQLLMIPASVAKSYLVSPLECFLHDAMELDPEGRAALDDARIIFLAVVGALETTHDKLRWQRLGLADRSDIELLNGLCPVLAGIARDIGAEPLHPLWRIRRHLEILLDPRRGVDALVGGK